MNSVFDVLFLRRPAIEYTSPAICESLFSGSSFPVITLNPLDRLLGPTGLVSGGVGSAHKLSWSNYPGALCYSVYKLVDELDPNGAYQLIAECVTDTFFDPDDPGTYRITVITPDGESPLSDPVIILAVGPPPPADPNRPTVDPLEWWTFEDDVLAPKSVGSIQGIELDKATNVGGKIGQSGPSLTNDSFESDPFPASIAGMTSTTFDITFQYRWDFIQSAESANFTIIRGTVLDNTGSTLGSVEFHWLANSARFQLRIRDEFGSVQVSNFFTTVFNPVVGDWYFIRLSYDGVTGRASFNVYGEVSHITTSSFVMSGAADSFIVNGEVLGTPPTNGGTAVYDELAVWNYTLTGPQETFLFNENIGRTWPY